VDRSLSLTLTGWRMTREDEDLSPPCATWPERASSRPKLSRDLGFGLSILAQRSRIRTIGPTIRARFIFSRRATADSSGYATRPVMIAGVKALKESTFDISRIFIIMKIQRHYIPFMTMFSAESSL